MSRGIKKILAIETSCDDTSVAILENDFVLSMKSLNQDSIHAPYGGVIPELACRNHTMRLLHLVSDVLDKTNLSLESIDGFAVTNRPGLLGSLLVGLATAKTLSMYYKKPLIGVNHLTGHLHAAFLKDSTYDPQLEIIYPFLGLCVSGGHTSLYWVKSIESSKVLGATRDDAAGEAFDKIGKLLGLGYPAGAAVDQRAMDGNSNRFILPRPLSKDKTLDYSFSGLKTAASLLIKSTKELNSEVVDDICASYQEAIVDSLLLKLDLAWKKCKAKRVVISGGVACNSRLRKRAQEWADRNKVVLLIPPPRYCTDNAGMIGYVGGKLLRAGKRSPLSLPARANLEAKSNA